MAIRLDKHYKRRFKAPRILEQTQEVDLKKQINRKSIELWMATLPNPAFNVADHRKSSGEKSLTPKSKRIKKTPQKSAINTRSKGSKGKEASKVIVNDKEEVLEIDNEVFLSTPGSRQKVSQYHDQSVTEEIAMKVRRNSSKVQDSQIGHEANTTFIENVQSSGERMSIVGKLMQFAYTGYGNKGLQQSDGNTIVSDVKDKQDEYMSCNSDVDSVNEELSETIVSADQINISSNESSKQIDKVASESNGLAVNEENSIDWQKEVVEQQVDQEDKEDKDNNEQEEQTKEKPQKGQDQGEQPIPQQELTEKEREEIQISQDNMTQILQMLTRMENRLQNIDRRLKSVEEGQAKKIEAIETEVKKLQTVPKKIQQIETRMDVQKKKLQVVSDKVDQVTIDRDKFNFMIDLLIGQEQRITHLNDKVTDMQVRSMKANLVINGLPQQENEDCKEVVSTFFKEKMKIEEEVKIDVAHRIGAGKTRAMVVRLKDPSEKAKIFTSVSKLKGKKNSEDKHYSVGDQLPEAIAERQRQMRMHYKDNQDHLVKDRLAMEFKKGTLLVEGRSYCKQLRPPVAKDMLTVNQSTLQQAMKTNIVQGKVFRDQGSVFCGFACEVNNIIDVESAYMKMRMEHGQASHISCAYRLMQCVGPYNQECVDDGEHGAARNMLSLLKKKKAFNTAVFVVRYHGGVNIGPDRFILIQEAAKSAYDALINSDFEALQEEH